MPLIVFGGASTNSITRGNLYGAMDSPGEVLQLGDFRGAGLDTVAEHHERLDHRAAVRVGRPDRRDFGDVRMSEQRLLHLESSDVVAA